MDIWNKITSFEFWLQVIESIKDLGPSAPIFLTFIESLIPALPLIVIVSFNVSIYGTWLGFIYSWIGSFIGSVLVFSIFRLVVKKHLVPFIQKHQKLNQLANCISVKGYNVLFLLTCLPFTPSSLINIVYGLSDIDSNFFIPTIALSKAIMIGYLAFFGYSLSQILKNPVWIILSIISMIILYFISKKLSKRHLGE